MTRCYELVEKVKSYNPAADEDALSRAYVYAVCMHGSQKRASGDPYFSHPVEVAGILAHYRLDVPTIVTALLHDVVEDTDATLGDVHRLFGPEVARLVDGVTKVSQAEVKSGALSYGESFRKLLIAMSEDIRVLLVKLADRLHNMRTLHYIKKPKKRRRIALETLEIYAPLSERIGMQEFRTEMEDHAFSELYSDVRMSITARLEFFRGQDDGLVESILSDLRDVCANAGLKAHFCGREKSPYSIWRKIQRKDVSFEQLSDVMAFRAVMSSVEDCYQALGILHGHYNVLPGRFKDYISTPKPNGYRALHTGVIGPGQRRIEIQLLTNDMHATNESGVAAHWGYKGRKGGSKPEADSSRYRWLRQLIEILKHAANPEDFLAHTKLEMFQDQVFCFTPKGDLIALPQGSTPVDFAYAIHAQIGDTCVGARVNNRLTSLRTPLENGSQVEILTGPRKMPNPEWARFVVSGKALACIRSSRRRQQRSTTQTR